MSERERAMKNNLISEDYLMHYGVKGMKWGVRHDRYAKGERMSSNSNDSPVTKKVKSDYNNLSDTEFKRKYQTSKNTYRKRVNRYGDPYMNSPLAKFGKRQSNKQIDRVLKSNEQLAKDAKTFEPYRKTGLESKWKTSKEGTTKTIMTSKDVSDSIRGIHQVRLNQIAKYDGYDRGKKETSKLMKELSKDYSIIYDISSGQYKLKEK